MRLTWWILISCWYPLASPWPSSPWKCACVTAKLIMHKNISILNQSLRLVIYDCTYRLYRLISYNKLINLFLKYWETKTTSTQCSGSGSGGSITGLLDPGPDPYYFIKDSKIFLKKFNTLMKKKTKLSLYIRKFRWDRVQSDIWGRAS